MTLPTPPAELPTGADPRVYGPALSWWTSACERLGHLPARRDLRPETLGAATLPHVVLVDVGEMGARLRFRLMGSAHVAYNNADLSGRDFSSIHPNAEVLNYVRGLYRDLCLSRRPLWSVNQVPHVRTGVPVVVQRLMLPLATDGREVDVCLGIQTFHHTAILSDDVPNPWHVAPLVGEVERRGL